MTTRMITIGCPAGSVRFTIVSVCWFITHLFMGRIQPSYISYIGVIIQFG